MSFVPTMSLCLKTRWVAKSLKKENSGEIKSFSNIFKRFGSSREKDLFQFICSSTQKSFTEQRNLYKKQGFFQKLFINNRVLFLKKKDGHLTFKGKNIQKELSRLCAGVLAPLLIELLTEHLSPVLV